MCTHTATASPPRWKELFLPHSQNLLLFAGTPPSAPHPTAEPTPLPPFHPTLSSPELSPLRAAQPQLPSCPTWKGGSIPPLISVALQQLHISPAWRTPPLDAALRLRHLSTGTPPPTPHRRVAAVGLGAAGVIQARGGGGPPPPHTPHRPGAPLLPPRQYLGEDDSSCIHHTAGRIDPHGAGGRGGQQTAPVDGQSAVGAARGHQQHRGGPDGAPHVMQRIAAPHRPHVQNVD